MSRHKEIKGLELRGDVIGGEGRCYHPTDSKTRTTDL